MQRKIFEYWQKLVLIHRDEKYVSESDILLMKEDLLGVLQDSMEMKGNLKVWLKYIFLELKIKDLFKSSETFPDEWENLKKLWAEVSEEKYKDYDTSKFSKIGKPDNQITISTRHSSKGLEFEVVVMMGMEEKHFPGWRVDKDPKALEESNRICFVCVSRAKRVCILMHSSYYNEMDYRYGEICCKRYYPSRYLLQLRKKFI